MSRSARRAELTNLMGAVSFVAYGDNECDEVAEALSGQADVVLECVGVPSFLGKAIEHVRLLGQVLSLGFCTSPDPVVPAVAGFKGVSLQFPVGYSRRDFAYAAQSMLSGHVDPKVMISNVVGLDDFPAMFERLLGPDSESKVQVSPH